MTTTARNRTIGAWTISVGALACVLGPIAGCDDGECTGSSCGTEDADVTDASSSDAGSGDASEDAGSVVDCSALLGLYVQGSCSVVSSDVEPFEPRYRLWTDGATKERFIRLPAGSTIDATDPNRFVFPVGTIVWKNFSRDGIRVETRMMRKTVAGLGRNAWEMKTFAWNASATSVTEVTAGVTDALGTPHDIPAAPSSCQQCHDRGDAVAGFGALALNHAGPGLTLSDLVGSGRLANLPAGFDTSWANLPSSLSAADQEAIGYLHANCGNCHRGAQAGGGLQLWAPIHVTDPLQLPVFVSAVGQPTTAYMTGIPRIDPGSPSTSAVILRMATRDVPDAGSMGQMPPIGTEIVDPDGLASVSAFITALP